MFETYRPGREIVQQRAVDHPVQLYHGMNKYENKNVLE